MPRKGTAYPINEEWRSLVSAGIRKMGISRSEFCRRAGISKAALSEALSPESQQTSLAPTINKVLGLPPPRSMTLAPDIEEVLRVVARMDPRDRARVLERALMLEEQRRKDRG